MANEFKHKSVGTALTQLEYEAVGGHEADGQLLNDMLYFNGTYWIRATPAAIAAMIDLINLKTKPHSGLTGIGASDHHIKTTSFADITDRAGITKLNFTLNKLLKGAGAGADPTEFDFGEQSFHNLLSNGDFEVGDPPSGWTLFFGAGATFARSSAQKKIGDYSAILTRVTNDCGAQQLHADYLRYRARKVTLGIWVWASVASRACTYIGDGVTGTRSSYHTGGSTWEWITLTVTVGGNATELKSAIFVEGGDTSAYFDGAMLVEGEVCPAFSDKPLPLDQKAAASGVPSLNASSLVVQKPADRLGLANLEFTAAKLLRGAGAGVNPTEIDVPVTATKELFGTVYYAIEMVNTGARIDGAGDSGAMRILVPQDFSSISNIEVLLRPRETAASMHFEITTYYGSYSSEGWATHSETEAGRDIGAVVSDQNAAHSISDLVDAAALAAGDLLVIIVNYDATAVDSNADIAGIRLKYA